MSVPSLTKSEQIVDELRRMILAGEVERGARLRQDELAQRFNASITPVREAMRLLVAEGIVTSEPRRGVRVAGVDLSRVTGVYIVRRLSECYAMRRVVDRVTPRDLRLVDGLLSRLDEAAQGGDPSALRELNREFHFFFYERCGLPALCDEIAAMWQSFPWDLMLTSPDRRAESAREHADIVAAVRAGNADRAAQITESHIMHGYLSIAAHLTGGPVDDPFDLHGD